MQNSADSPDREIAWLVPFSERWVLRYTLLGGCGLFLLAPALVARVWWLEVLGALLLLPFLLWAGVFLTIGYGYLTLVVLPAAIWRRLRRNRPGG